MKNKYMPMQNIIKIPHDTPPKKVDEIMRGFYVQWMAEYGAIPPYTIVEEQDESQTAKADSGKLDLTLVPPQIIYEIAEIRRFGNEKYHDPENWKQVEIERYWCACLRHILAAWNDFRSIDEESGLKHISHASCNLAFILQKLKEEEIHENT